MLLFLTPRKRKEREKTSQLLCENTADQLDCLLRKQEQDASTCKGRQRLRSRSCPALHILQVHNSLSSLLHRRMERQELDANLQV